MNSSPSFSTKYHDNHSFRTIIAKWSDVRNAYYVMIDKESTLVSTSLYPVICASCTTFGSLPVELIYMIIFRCTSKSLLALMFAYKSFAIFILRMSRLSAHDVEKFVRVYLDVSALELNNIVDRIYTTAFYFKDLKTFNYMYNKLVMVSMRALFSNIMNSTYKEAMIVTPSTGEFRMDSTSSTLYTLPKRVYNLYSLGTFCYDCRVNGDGQFLVRLSVESLPLRMGKYGYIEPSLYFVYDAAVFVNGDADEHFHLYEHYVKVRYFLLVPIKRTTMHTPTSHRYLVLSTGMRDSKGYTSGNIHHPYGPVPANWIRNTIRKLLCKIFKSLVY